MSKSKLLVVLFCFGAGSVTAAPPSPPVNTKPKLTIAFPKSVNRLETARLYGSYLAHVRDCAKVSLVNTRGEPVDNTLNSLDLLSEDELVQGLTDKSLEIAQLSSGIVPVAVSKSAVVPFAIRGNSKTKEIGSYRLHLIVRTDSAFRKPADLKGSKIAHTTPGSNSGNLAPRAYFPSIGLVPDQDYEVIYSKGHERSVVGVLHGFWPAAAIASDQFDRMVTKGEIRPGAFRVLWKSDPFPASAFVFGSHVPAALRDRVTQCTYQFRFSKQMQTLLDGSDAFLPVDYDKHYEPVRFVLQKTSSLSKAPK